MDQDENAYEFSNRPRVLMTVGDSGAADFLLHEE